ncbi:MAG: carboxypeptidase-like regulatory domain-containing protein, partial [Pedobacter sp.]
MYSRLLFTLLLVWWASSSIAQSTYTLSGSVRDSASGQPIVRAAVVLDYEKSTKGTHTDSQGHFAITTQPGQHIVVVRSLGYVPFRTTLYLR